MTVYFKSQIASLYVQNNLEDNTIGYQRTMTQLSSGHKFLSSSEDAVSFALSTKYETRISGNEQALSNISLGKNLLTLAEDNQQGAISNLQRIRDLCMEAANQTYASKDKDAILVEIRQRIAMLDNTAENTKFGDVSLLDGSSDSLSLQVGLDPSTGTLDIGGAFQNVHASVLGGDIRLPDTVTGANWTGADVKAYMSKIDDAINDLTNNCASAGSYINRLDSTYDTLTIMNTGLTEDNSSIMDVDVAQATADMAKYQILQQASATILIQVNQLPSMALSLLKH